MLNHQTDHKTDTLVVPRSIIEPQPPYTPWTAVADDIQQNALWMPRPDAEISTQYVQLIPAATIQDQSGRYHTFSRRKSAYEYLSEKWSIIVGGHVEPEDRSIDIVSTMANTLRRELLEELGVNHRPTTPNTVVFDPRSPHVAILYEVQVHQPVTTTTTDEFEDSPSQPVRLLDGEQIFQHHSDRLDPWSKTIIEQITSVAP